MSISRPLHKCILSTSVTTFSTPYLVTFISFPATSSSQILFELNVNCFTSLAPLTSPANFAKIIFSVETFILKKIP